MQFAGLFGHRVHELPFVFVLFDEMLYEPLHARPERFLNPERDEAQRRPRQRDSPQGGFGIAVCGGCGRRQGGEPASRLTSNNY